MDTCLPKLSRHLGIKLTKAEQKMNVRPLIALICRRFFGDFSAFVDLVVKNIKSPLENGRLKVEHCYSGDVTSELAKDVSRCDVNVIICNNFLTYF